jgi:hypothetical protein
MTSPTPRIITIALATLALAAPAATAMPLYEHDGTPPPAHRQDLRNADQRAPGIAIVPAQQPTTMAPVERTKPVPAVSDGNDPSPLVFILPSLVLLAMLGVATAYVKSTRRVGSIA